MWIRLEVGGWVEERFGEDVVVLSVGWGDNISRRSRDTGGWPFWRDGFLFSN